MTARADAGELSPALDVHGLSVDLVERLAAQVCGSGLRVPVHTPFTGGVLTELATSTPEDVEAAYRRAREAQESWKQTPVRYRAAVLRRYHQLVLQDTSVVDVIQAETGKSRGHAVEEIVDVAGVALYYGRKAESILRAHRRRGAVPFATRATELRHPKGVVAIIAPFNAPLSLSACDVLPAVVAGNAVVVKPDSQTVLTAIRARELLVEAGLPEDLFQVVVGEPAVVGDALLDGADHVAFTGSTATGRRIAAEAARRLIGCTLELGGKNPMIVLDDADVSAAARGAVRACFTGTGQICLTVERLYVHSSLYDAFVSQFVEHANDLVLGSGLGFDYDLGPLSSQRQLDQVVRHVEEAVALGARVAAGGKARPDLGPFHYEPTILVDVPPEAELYAEETFGPVVSVYRFDDVDEVIARANDSEYGLSASIWSSNTPRARKIAARIESGLVNINEGFGSAYASNDAPMGGMKASGQGYRHGTAGLLELCELQTVASQHWVSFDPPPGASREQVARQVVEMYRLMRRLRLR